MGYLSRGKKHKHGTEVIDALIYRGHYDHGRKHGAFTVTRQTSQELLFQGQFRMDRMHGHCVLKTPTHDFEGNVDMGVYHGQCSIRYANADRFEGSMANGSIQGHGRLRYANGDVYEGQFRDNLMHGQGKYTWRNGQKYEGEFTRGRIPRSGMAMYNSVSTTVSADLG